MISLSDIFYIDSGSNLDLNKLEINIINNEKSIPFVSRTKKNNGVVEFVKYDKKYKLNKAGTISVALVGNVMTSYFHNYNYYSSQGVAILTPKIYLTEYEMIYYCLCLKKNYIKYNYGRTPDKSLSEIKIPKSIPDYIEKKNIPKIKHYTKVYNSLELTNILFEDFFEVYIGKTVKCLNELEHGDTPIISATEYNNGISFTANISPEFNFKSLTISKNGSVGEVFYQDTPFSSTKDIFVIKPKFQITDNIGLFLAVIFKLYFKTKFSYGRKITLTKLNKSIIPLPLLNNQIDIYAINEFMKGMSDDYYSNFDKSSNLSKFIVI